MKLTFLGTRGGITKRSAIHYNHSSLLISAERTRILIDFGDDWINKINTIKPHAILLTHAHPDHVGGLKNGAPCPVYATQETFDRIKTYPLDKRIIVPHAPFKIGAIQCEAYRLEHSLNAPAVGYKITHHKSFFYAPDIVSIHRQKEALHNLALYVGDGAIITRSILIKQRNGNRIGHSPISTQLEWCKQARVPRVIITHCGTEIVNGEIQKINEKIKKLSEAYDIMIEIAYDGMVARITKRSKSA